MGPFAFEDDGVGLVNQVLDHGCGGYGVAEGLCPRDRILVATSRIPLGEQGAISGVA